MILFFICFAFFIVFVLEMWGYGHSINPKDVKRQIDPALLYKEDKPFLEALKSAKISMYNLGCPLVGDTNFKNVS